MYTSQSVALAQSISSTKLSGFRERHRTHCDDYAKQLESRYAAVSGMYEETCAMSAAWRKGRERELYLVGHFLTVTLTFNALYGQ